VEGGIPVLDRDGRPRIYCQPTFGAMMYTGSDTWTGVYDAPVQINWPLPLFIGNGDIISLDTIEKQQIAFSQRTDTGMRLDATFGETLIQATRIFAENNYWYINCDPSGNGPQSSDILWMSVSGTTPITTFTGEVRSLTDVSSYGGGNLLWLRASDRRIWFNSVTALEFPPAAAGVILLPSSGGTLALKSSSGGSFTSNDGKTITVTDGIITNIV